MAERTTVRLPDELLRRAKQSAAKQGSTLTALIEEGLRRVLAEEGRTGRAQRVLPPVAEETGGMQPGFDFDDLKALQEGEDLEYVERMRNGFT